MARRRRWSKERRLKWIESKALKMGMMWACPEVKAAQEWVKGLGITNFLHYDLKVTKTADTFTIRLAPGGAMKRMAEKCRDLYNAKNPLWERIKGG